MFEKRLILCLFLLTTSFVYAQDSPVDNSRKIEGGPCKYEHFAGKCEIISVKKAGDSVRQKDALGGPGYEGYEVKFEFILPEIYPREGISYEEYMENSASQVGYALRGAHTMLLTNSWYPGPRFIKKYKITRGVVFDCTLDIIKSGTCTPVILTFDTIDLSDYFEGR